MLPLRLSLPEKYGEKLMKHRASGFSGFIFSFLLNSFWHLRWTVPAWVLLALHFWLKISVWWSLSCFGLFLAAMLIYCLLLNSMISAGSYTDKEKPNLNPYSAKMSDILPDKNKKE